MSSILWQTVLGEIEVSVSRANFVTWFKNTQLLEKRGSEVIVGVPNTYIKRNLEEKFHDHIIKTLRKNDATIQNVTYVINDIATRSAPRDLDIRPPQRPQGQGQLNKKYSFDNFIVGGSNQLAYVACRATAESPGEKYNPLFIYGGVGLGKTHLIQAVGNEVLKKNNGATVEYVTCEQFMKEFVNSIQKKRSFSTRYRHADVLIVDDLQFISGKEKTQEEFFHTFNALHQANKQIIISSDRPPRDITTLEERLRTRLEWGMTIDIQSPDYETRLAILRSKAEERGSQLSDEVTEFLATQIQTNVRELEGSLTKLLAYTEMAHREPTLEIAKQLVEPRAQRHTHLTPKLIVDKTARYFSLSVEDLRGPKRDKDIVEPRQIAMYLLRSELHLSFPQVAKQVGRKDHTTAIHSVNKIELLLPKNHLLRQRVAELRERLYA